VLECWISRLLTPPLLLSFSRCFITVATVNLQSPSTTLILSLWPPKMSTVAPQDGGSNPAKLKDKLKHPLEHMREKFQDTKLYDVKVALSHKK
jgi:hypothetical protein